MLGRSLRLVRACGELTGTAPERGSHDVVGQRAAKGVLGDRERVLVSERACRIAGLHEGASALRWAASRKALGKTRGRAIVMERLGQRVQRDRAFARSHRV